MKQSSAVHIQAPYSADVILLGSSSKLRLLVINLASVPGGQLVNSPTAQSPARYTQAQMASRMKNWLFLFSTIYTVNVYSQDTLSLNQIQFNQIQSVGYNLQPGTHTPIYEDTAFNYFLKQKTKSLQFLIEKISDTTFTSIERKSTNGFYKKGDLAVILLSNIEFIPYAAITGNQWCICCETGYIPVDFFSYVDKYRLDFQWKYKNYCLEQERKKSSKRNRKGRKT